MLSTHSIKVILISTDLDYLMEFRARMIFERHSYSMAVEMHFFISSCMNSEVVMDFFIIVRTIL